MIGAAPPGRGNITARAGFVDTAGQLDADFFGVSPDAARTSCDALEDLDLSAFVLDCAIVWRSGSTRSRSARLEYPIPEMQAS
ncbi:hypothetical protein ACLMAJ_11965 [Nocardia sp. KC 131]|uniref:hypothetical protein n=1 Tax=Nocardia arseniciresistens TaxID=3392119 RepID=UPI00398F5D17